LSEESAYRELANAIVVQAVDDWRKLCKRQEPNCKFTEIRQFFKSDWCAMLCGNVDPLLILDALERERKTAVNKI
jgi:hypothetical protein